MAEREQVRQIKDLHQEAILARPNVVGVGVGHKTTGGRTSPELCIVAMVRQKIPAAGLAPAALLPQEIGGIATDVVQVGELRALQSPTGRWRPAPGGVSIGHYQITAGTLGTIVRDRASGQRLILSNNHVLANSNDAQIGDPILQPGTYDGGKVDQDTIAHLERFQPIQFSVEPPTCGPAKFYASLGNALAGLFGSSHRFETFRANPQAANLVDAALARPVEDGLVLDEILNIGVVAGVAPGRLGMAVRKMGRTTGLTSGQITILDATVNVGYGQNRIVRFENQIVTSAMSQGGDSGSLLVAGETLQAVGLLFAGSEQTTVHNPIQTVLDLLEIDL